MNKKRNEGQKGEFYDTVGKGLSRIMKDYELTVTKIAEIIGVSDLKTVRDWKWGRTIPKGEYLIKLSDFLGGISVDYILGRTDYLHVGNEEIIKRLGLSEKSIEILDRMYNYKGIPAYSQINRKNIDGLNYILEQDFEWIKESEHMPVTTILGKMEEYMFSDTATFEVTKINENTMQDLGYYKIYARHHKRPKNGALAFGIGDYRYDLHLSSLYATSLLNEIVNKLNDLKESTKQTW